MGVFCTLSIIQFYSIYKNQKLKSIFKGDSPEQPASEQLEPSSETAVAVSLEQEDRVDTQQGEPCETSGATTAVEPPPSFTEPLPSATEPRPPASDLPSPESAPQSPTSSSDTHEWYNSQGVRFTPQEEGMVTLPRV